MIRSCFLRLMAFLAVGMPLLLVVSWSWASFSHIRVTGFVASSAHESREIQKKGMQVRSLDQDFQTLPSSGLSVVGGPSLSASFVNRVLVEAHSPAQGTGQVLYDLSREYQIDNAFALAVFAMESSFGKAGVAAHTRGLGNIICAGYPTCDGRFRSYRTWQEGYADFYRLLVTEYIPRGLSTVEVIVPVYAPSSENDVELYISSVKRFMNAFRLGKMTP